MKKPEELVEHMTWTNADLSTIAASQFHILVARASRTVAVAYNIETRPHPREKLPQVKAASISACGTETVNRAEEPL